MKKIISLLTSLLLTLLTNAQWQQVGQDIFGENVGDLTGSSVSINDEGNRIALYDAFVNGDSRGRIRVFELQNDSWIQLGNGIIGLIGDGQALGTVKFNSIGNRFIFSNPLHAANGINLSGIARVFELQNDNWIQIGDNLVGLQEEDFFGVSVDISGDGNTVIVGASQQGMIVSSPGYTKVYRFLNDNWTQLGSQINGANNGDETGKSVSTNNDGSVIAVSSPLNDDNGIDSGKVRIFKFENDSWIQSGNDIYGQGTEDRLGNSVNSNSSLSLDFDGNRIAIGATDHSVNEIKVGQVRIFENQSNNWIQLGQSIDGALPFGFFGVTVSLNDDGNIVAVGASFGVNSGIGIINNGQVKVFKISNNVWIQEGESMTGEENSDWAGMCVSINSLGNKIVFGSLGNNDNGDNSGKVQIFQNDNVLSVLEQSGFDNIDLFPNPNDGNFTLKSPESKDKVFIKITDVLGKKVFQKKGFLSQNTPVNSELKAGVYFVNIRANEVNQTVKIVIL